MNNSLYEIRNRFIELQEKEELTEEELQEKQREVENALINKSNNLIAYDRNLSALEENIDAEIKRLQEYKKKVKTRQEKYREYIKNCMEQMGYIKIESPLGVLSIRKCPLSVEITNEELVPEEYKQEITTTKIDKKAILSNFKDTGELLDGTKIITDKTSLMIK